MTGELMEWKSNHVKQQVLLLKLQLLMGMEQHPRRTTGALTEITTPHGKEGLPSASLLQHLSVDQWK
jgi:hypothetical protein